MRKQSEVLVCDRCETETHVLIGRELSVHFDERPPVGENARRAIEFAELCGRCDRAVQHAVNTIVLKDKPFALERKPREPKPAKAPRRTRKDKYPGPTAIGQAS